MIKLSGLGSQVMAGTAALSLRRRAGFGDYIGTRVALLDQPLLNTPAGCFAAGSLGRSSIRIALPPSSARSLTTSNPI